MVLIVKTGAQKMKTIIDYIDDLKEKTGSDYASSKAMNCDRSVISNIRKRGAIAEENAIKLADLLGIERSEILLIAAIARSEGVVKKEWIDISKKVGMAVVIYGVNYELINQGTFYTLCEVNKLKAA